MFKSLKNKLNVEKKNLAVPSFNKKKFKRNLQIYLGLAQGKESIIESLSFLISSGMPIADSLQAIEGELPKSFLKRIIGEARENVEDGMSLSNAFLETGIFSSHAVSLIKSGEDSGTLSENLKVIAEQDAKNKVFKSRLQSALMYPIIVLTVTFIVGLGVAWFILPKLATVFSQLQVKLPLITKIFINIGVYLDQYGVIVVPIFIGLVFLAIYILFYNHKTRFLGQEVVFALPGVAKLIKELEIARLGYLMGALTKAGLPPLEAIASVRESTFSPYYQKFYEHLYKGIEEGKSFEQSFKEFENLGILIPASIQRMIVTGEQSAHLTEVFTQIGDTYEAKTEITSKNLAVALEPILLVLVWVGVVLVALAVILPVYSLVGNLNH